MKRQELLLNLTLLVIIGTLIYLIYDSKELPRSLDELDVAPVHVENSEGKASALDEDDDEDDDVAEDDMETTATASETSGSKRKSADKGTSATAGADDAPPGTESMYASAKKTPNRGGTFGQRNLFRALLTPTPTPPPPTPTPAPTPDINSTLGTWRLLSVYEGKAMMEDAKASEAGDEGAVWEMAQGDTKQVDVGNGIMKTARLSHIDNENPYNPEVTFTLEDTKAEKKINLDTEPATAAPAAAPKR